MHSRIHPTRSRLPKKETACCSQTRNQEIMLVPPPKSWLNVRTRPSYMDTSTVQRECTSLPGILCASSKSSGARAMAWLHLQVLDAHHGRDPWTPAPLQNQKSNSRGSQFSVLASTTLPPTIARKTASQHRRRQRVYKRALRAPCQNETKRNETKQNNARISTLMSCREIDTSYNKYI